MNELYTYILEIVDGISHCSILNDLGDLIRPALAFCDTLPSKVRNSNRTFKDTYLEAGIVEDIPHEV
jgi:hypothetical protein